MSDTEEDPIVVAVRNFREAREAHSRALVATTAARKFETEATNARNAAWTRLQTVLNAAGIAVTRP